jgi:hypothetical protein
MQKTRKIKKGDLLNVDPCCPTFSAVQGNVLAIVEDWVEAKEYPVSGK